MKYCKTQYANTTYVSFLYIKMRVFVEDIVNSSFTQFCSNLNKKVMAVINYQNKAAIERWKIGKYFNSNGVSYWNILNIIILWTFSIVDSCLGLLFYFSTG